MNPKIFLNWFSIFGVLENTNTSLMSNSHVNFLSGLSLETLNLISQSVKGLWIKVDNGFTISDIETTIFFILCIRFSIIALRYNMKTSGLITFIGLIAAYLWYRHLIDVIGQYRGSLVTLPFLNKLGIEAVQLASANQQIVLTDLKIGDNAHWYNPGQVIYFAIRRGIVDVNPETGFRYYIDPISMIIANLKEPDRSNALPLYYEFYNRAIPSLLTSSSKFWSQLSGIAAYTFITRVGKRYCPYLIRWHWTFLLLLGLIEQLVVQFINRIENFQTFVLTPQLEASQLEAYEDYLDSNLLMQYHILDIALVGLIFGHIGLILFAMFHALCGQYFYIPFLVENIELHVGPRPKNSIYSGGYTSWQEPEEKTPGFTKLWYGWFGRGTNKRGRNMFQSILKKILNKLNKKRRKK